MPIGGLLRAVSPLVSILSGLLGGNIVYDWNSLVRDTIGYTKRWTPVAYFPQGTSVPFWHTNLNITGAPPAFPGEQFAYDRFVPPPPAPGQVAPSGSAVRAQEQSTRGRVGAGALEDPACPKAIINDNIPSFLLAVVVALRGQEALIPPVDPQWNTYPVNSTSQTTFGPYYRGGDSPVWNGEQQLLDAKAVYCAGYNSIYPFAGGWTSGEWPGNRLANIPAGTMVHVVYRGSDNLILPDEPKLVGRVFGYITGICSYQITTEAGNTDAPTNFAQGM